LTDIDRAIGYIETSLDSHLAWLKVVPKLRRVDRAMAEAADVMLGSVEFHKKAVRDYTFVLKVLRRVKNGRS
jgi:hypothetical protein